MTMVCEWVACYDSRVSTSVYYPTHHYDYRTTTNLHHFHSSTLAVVSYEVDLVSVECLVA